MADIVFGFEDTTGAIYRSILYTKATLLDTAGTTYTRPVLPTLTGGAGTVTHTEVVLSPVAGGTGNGKQTEHDVHSTTKLLLVDMQLQGNLDIVYTSDANGPARVSYARPPSDITPTLNEKRNVEAELTAIKTGMLAWLDEALAAYAATPLPDDTQQRPLGHISPWDDTSDATYPATYAATLTAGIQQGNVENDDGSTTLGNYLSPGGDIQSTIDTSPPNHTSGLHCRAPAEEVVPVRTQFKPTHTRPHTPFKSSALAVGAAKIQQLLTDGKSTRLFFAKFQLSLQIDFPQVPCSKEEFPGLVLRRISCNLLSNSPL